MSTWILDIETTDLTGNTLTLVGVLNTATGQTLSFKRGQGFIETMAEHGVDKYVGHNIIAFDWPVLKKHFPALLLPKNGLLDTLVVSRLLWYAKPNGHSLEALSIEAGCPKQTNFTAFGEWSEQLEDYNLQDLRASWAVLRRFEKYLNDPAWADALQTEHQAAWLCQNIHEHGFTFNVAGATRLYQELLSLQCDLDQKIQAGFKPRAVSGKLITPRLTKTGTLNSSDFRWLSDGDLTPYGVGASFTRVTFEPFNPSSPKQIVTRLNKLGWRPTEKTKGHIAALRDRTIEPERLKQFKEFGWTVSETNLSTLPTDAPEAAHSLAQRLTVSSRLSDLEEWLSHIWTTIKIKQKPTSLGLDLTRSLSECIKASGAVVKFESAPAAALLIKIPPLIDGGCIEGVLAVLDGLRLNGVEYTITDQRIHSRPMSIGAWTHRMAHRSPNTGNIASEFPDQSSYTAVELIKKEYDGQLRGLWGVPNEYWQVGVDMDSAHLRILAHLINDPQFTRGLISGNKKDGTDPHSMNQRALGEMCKSRDAAKTVIYTWLNGGGAGKIAHILGCTVPQARLAIARFIESYPGLDRLYKEQIPADAKRGYFVGIDGRKVIYGQEHGMMAGYLQNAEAILLKSAAWLALQKAEQLVPVKLLNLVHDEIQIEVQSSNKMVAARVGGVFTEELRRTGEYYGLRCPIAGNMTIGKTWRDAH